jgi:hypothetical protein
VLRTFRRRTPRATDVVTPLIATGNRNNGRIQVQMDDDDSDSEEMTQEDGVTYKLPAKTVFLDFVAKAKL